MAAGPGPITAEAGTDPFENFEDASDGTSEAGPPKDSDSVCTPRGRCVKKDVALHERLIDADACSLESSRLMSATCPHASTFESEVGCHSALIKSRFGTSDACVEKICSTSNARGRS